MAAYTFKDNIEVLDIFKYNQQWLILQPLDFTTVFYDHHRLQ